MLCGHLLCNPDYGQVGKLLPAASRLKRLKRSGEDFIGLFHLVHVLFASQSVSIGMRE